MRPPLLATLALPGCLPTGCDGDLPALLSSEEEQAIVRRFEARAKEAAALTCPRPVLRGSSVPGDGGPALASLVKIDGPHAACLELMDRLAESRPKADTSLKPPRFSTLTTEQREAVATTCAALADAIPAVVRHAELCAPFMIGRAPPPESLLGPIRVGTAVGVLAAQRAADGQPAEGIALALDGLRLFHDLQRGVRTLLIATLAQGGHSEVAMSLGELLDDPRLTTDQLAEIARALDVLIETLPPVGGILADDMNDVGYRTALIDLMPPGWTPKGGHDPNAPKRRTLSDKDRNESLTALMALDESIEAYDELCPQGADLRTCEEGLARYESVVKQIGEDRDKIAQDPEGGDLPAATVQLRREMLLVLHNIVTPNYLIFLRRIASQEAQLRALRLQVEAHRLAGGHGRCPPASAFTEAPLKALKQVGSLRQGLKVVPVEGGYQLTAPAEQLGDQPQQPDVALVSLRCAPSEAPTLEAPGGDGGQTP